MQYATATLLIAFFGLATAAPTAGAKAAPARMLRGREVPQEHSHERFLTSVRASLNLDNVEKINDPVFGLLGNAAATGNCGSVTNLDCCHQATADRAFTNAKAAKDVTAMTDALIFATLERNTGGVGKKSVLCTDKAANPEIAALSQHQDPASEGAAAENKAIVLELAKQIKSIGGNPQDALLSGTFAPGDLADSTGKGNSCDTLDDPIGCIFTQNLIVDDATAAEIDAAVGGATVDTGAAAGNGTAAVTTEAPAAPVATEAPAATDAAAASDCVAVTSTVTVDAPAATDAAAADDSCPAPVISTITVDAAPEATAAPAASSVEAAAPAATTAAATPTTATGTNVQTFTGSLGAPPVPVESSTGDRPFSVNGNTFVNIGAALQRSCAIQNNACANAVNSKAIAGSVSDCNAQEQACNAAAKA